MLRRPARLLQRFYNEYLDSAGLSQQASPDLSKIPALVLSRPLLVHDVVLSKLHSAVLTTDPASNLYICGVGRGGRLGLGDENTRFNYVPVQGGLADRKVVQVALGQNHSLAITDTGELWTWGSNAHAQLGYALPAPAKTDEEPSSNTPRQVFGPLKKEAIIGVAASAIHSVAHTETSLYCWGKNVGQLALMDSDSRSLEVQQVPRKVAASLFSSPIIMVSAIDKATTCLLANHTVVCFTSYGYNIVKFPFTETFTNYHLKNVSMSARYEAARNQIQYITSGGETIAAVTGRGDLFTFGLSNKIDVNAAAASTTNPSKIKGAVTQPRCIWHARREGVRSVGVGEHGSVIISTESGAVWRRVKRAKAKDAYVSGSSETKTNDFKFQRVPYITKVVTVRASPFGTFAAVRRDSDVMTKQIQIEGQTIWDDVAPLNPLRGFKASESSRHDDDQSKDPLRFRDTDTLKGRLGSTPYEILKSPDLDADLEHHLSTWAHRNEPLDTAFCTSSSPELNIPVHGWLLSARSPVLRHAMTQYRKKGSYEHADTFRIDKVDGVAVITFAGLDLISVLNLVVFMYSDKVIPAWTFTRQAPPLAYRFRQIRTELMKVATRLEMSTLETCVRIQTEPKKSMDEDFMLATRDRGFFEDSDALLELDGLEVPVHSTFICRRCPWFEGLFHGRSQGAWLAGRRERRASSDRVRIDLKHIDPGAFKYVLQHIYADTGEELFDPVVSQSLNDFTDLVMDVMSIANELMLDRLAQICQKVIGRFANTRNIAHLLNEISPCSVAEFKEASLEYICLQIETMLENHLLDELDEDLLLDLDVVVRDNQLARFPFARSGRVDLLLHEKYPDLVQDIEEERQRRAREIGFRTTQRDEEKKLSSSFKARYGSLDDSAAATFSPDKPRKTYKLERNEPFSPDLRPKASHGDLIFDMDEEGPSGISSPLARPSKCLDTVSPSEVDELPSLSAPRIVLDSQRQASNHAKGIGEALSPAASRTGSPWASSALPTVKLDLREIIDSESTTNEPALSVGLATQKAKDVSSSKPVQTKLSQKERKKQQVQAAQAAQLQSTSQPSRAAWDKTTADGPAAPWKAVSAKDKAPPAEASAAQSPVPRTPTAKPLVAAESSSKSISRRTASPDTRFSGQSRVPSSNTAPMTSRSSPRPNAPTTPTAKPPTSSPAAQSQKPLVPHSKLYIMPARNTEPLLGLGLADIIGQQQREQEIVKEAVAKRSLQEIQQEQAFQEWWDAESRRTQEEEEARRVEREKGEGAKSAGGGGGGRRGRGRKSRGGGGGRGGGGNGRDGSVATPSLVPDSGVPEGQSPKRRGRGGGRGGGERGDGAAVGAQS